MKGLIIVGLLCTLAVQQTVLFSSSDTNTALTSPAGQSVALDTFHETNFGNHVGFNAHWIYKTGPNSWPAGDTATFTAQFYADCTLPGTIVICADNTFTVSLNGAAAMTGNDFPKLTYLTLNIKCGLNTLVIKVTNKDAGSPAGLIFAVTQDQSRCYSCQGPLSYYNRDTCKCECIDGCKCNPVGKIFAWQPYPICGCTCAKAYKCQDYQYWDDKTCSCKCKKIVCPPNQIQDMKTCKCKGKCLPLIACKPPLVWDFDLCTCVKAELDISLDLSLGN